jgi:peptidyl-prolyl cis-trans isomerase SurA
VLNVAVLNRSGRRPLPVLAAVSVGSAVLLTGCSVAGTDFHPGIAAEVGDDTITTRHVDQVTDDYCKAIEKVSKDQGQSGAQRTPLRYLTHDFANALFVEAAVKQLAEEYDVQPTSAYKTDLAQLEPQLVNLSDAEKDAVREVIGARAYAQDVLTTIGGIELDKQGQKNPTNDDKYNQGQAVLKDWIADHNVEINPKYSLELDASAPVDTDLSYPLDSTAKNGLKAEPDAGYTSELGDSLTCLD